jgi:pSer/pThr/pTyr-binding forkhead associated (FHA) protein
VRGEREVSESTVGRTVVGSYCRGVQVSQSSHGDQVRAGSYTQ